MPKMPYTDFHALNQDWIIKTIKRMFSPDNPPPYPVESVNGKTGEVVLTGEDIDISEQNQTSIKAFCDALLTAIQAKYTLPSTGLPWDDLAQAVKDIINAKYNLPSGGLPWSDLSTGVKNTINNKYTLPANGIPMSQLDSNVSGLIYGAIQANGSQGSNGQIPVSNGSYSVWTNPQDIIPDLSSDIATAVNTWLTANITNPSSPPLDRSLTQSAAAAPADLVGDLKSNIKDIGNISYTKDSGFIANAGTISPPSSNNELYTSKIPAIAGQSFAFTFKSSTSNLGNWCAYGLYDDNLNFISRTVFINNVLGTEVSQIITIPQTSQNSNARYIAFTWRNFNDGAETITISDLNKVLSQVKNECIAPLILSQAKNYVDITISDTTSNIKFPADVLACTNSGYVQITAIDTEIDISSSVIATTAIKVVYNLNTNQFELCAYNIPLNPQQILIASIRRHTANPSIFIGCNYMLNGKPFGIDFINAHANVKSINHRGYYTAPENTLPAYILSKQKGFNYVECDVAFTLDDVAVLLHDATINRTARNADGSVITPEININDITYAQALQYDFGIYKSPSYAGTKIPTLAQFIGLCKNLGLYPYIEIKDTATYSQAQISGLVNIVKSYGMLNDVTWISFNSTYLGYVKNADSNARLGIVCGDITAEIINSATTLKNSTNDVFIDAYYVDPDHQVGSIPLCINAGIPVEVWTPDTSEAIEAMNPYITGVTSNRLIASSVLYAMQLNN